MAKCDNSTLTVGNGVKNPINVKCPKNSPKAKNFTLNCPVHLAHH